MKATKIRQQKILQERLFQHGYKSIFSWADRFQEHCKNVTKTERRQEDRVTGEVFCTYVKKMYG